MMGDEKFIMRTLISPLDLDLPTLSKIQQTVLLVLIYFLIWGIKVPRYITYMHKIYRIYFVVCSKIISIPVNRKENVDNNKNCIQKIARCLLTSKIFRFLETKDVIKMEFICREWCYLGNIYVIINFI